jgi:DNA-binding Xre family transcriptional regulator
MIRLRIAEVAKEHNISLASWARKADIDSKTVYRLTSNPYAEVTTHTLGKLADAIHVSIHDLVEDSPTNNANIPI